MNFGIYSHLVTTVIFCGLALALYILARLFRRKSAMLSSLDWKVIFLTMLTFAAVTGPEEYLALSGRIWAYNPERTLHTTFLGAEVENWLFIVLVSLVVSIATLTYARREDRQRKFLV